MKFIVILFSLLSLSWADDTIVTTRRFPTGFKLGVATAATQMEGAWDTDGKGETIWDNFARTRPEMISDRSTPAIASDTYHKYKEDIALVKEMGLDVYSLSIAWSRILPTGYVNNVNELGVQYYKNLLKELKDNGIEAMVSLYHWDLPQPLQDQYGGWLNETVVDLFIDYAKLCFELFGDDVQWWVPINEPMQICNAGYGDGRFAPGIISRGIGEYVCNKNVLLAHAKAYRLYDEQFRAKQGGKVTLVLDTFWYEPASNSSADLDASERLLQFGFGMFANPIVLGDWPKLVKDRIAMRSKLEGFPVSRLPEFTQEEIELVKGTYDYLALNHYSTHMASGIEELPIGEPSFTSDVSAREWVQSEWPTAADDSLPIVPWGMRKILVWLKKTYGDVEIVITENGFSDLTGGLEDDNRSDFIRDYLSNCLDTIYEDKVNVTGYIVWSILDNWQLRQGYEVFMGLYKVDFNDPNRPRIKRNSADYFTQIAKNRCLVDVSECTD